MDEIEYRHFRHNKKLDHEGTISIGFRTTIINGCTIVEYTVAICSPKDQFSKKKARNVIDQRFNNNKTIKFTFSESNVKINIPMIITHYNSHCANPAKYGFTGFKNSPVELPNHAKKIQFKTSNEMKSLMR